jgi:NNP family nitrate/nitrite transporter-like MFS transporter
MMLSASAGVLCVISHARAALARSGRSSPCFLVLFFATGVGNASTFQMIPAIMRNEIARLMPARRARCARGSRRSKESAAIIGFTSAIAAFGAFFIPKSFGTSIALTGGPRGGALRPSSPSTSPASPITWCVLHPPRRDARTTRCDRDRLADA